MSMSVVRLSGWIGIVAMAGAIVYGVVSGGFGEDFAAVWALPWGKVSLVDLFVGLFLVAVVIIWRERQVRRWLPWVVALLVLGNLTTGAYLIWALRDPVRRDAP